MWIHRWSADEATDRHVKGLFKLDGARHGLSLTGNDLCGSSTLAVDLHP